ncbi:hypothetical protein Nepgr_000886 [Nepenthes gracilis]|uniref:Uncharacterized protein n=1 Tax=Nepenthes gracilis TaxID=150966 RepID=A0AAD3P7K4_NEPGR|nr:hypothetical protein Nepgr_000886 [Nepenthes gracilis]
MATGSREARRRRILEGGSDRLAFITGRAQAPSTAQQDPDCTGRCSPPLISHQLDPEPHFSCQQPTVSHNEDITFNFTSPKHDHVSQSNQIDTFGDGSTEELLSRQAETDLMPSKSPQSQLYHEAESPREIQGAPPHSAINAVHHPAPKIHLDDPFAYQTITSAVAATEQTRVFCSLTMAFLVVLSYMRFPIVGSKLISGIIQFCPLFLVLLTNVALILHQLLSEKLKGFKKYEEEAGKSPTVDGCYGWADEAGKSLEMVFIAQCLIGALFMDCSVYTIVVICGLSVA